MNSPILMVELHGERVGVIERRNGGSRFVPEPSWAERPAGQRPIIGQRFEERPWTEIRSGQGLPDWFEHLLPEEGGPLRRSVARALGVKESRSFEIARLVGEDLPGALVLRSASESAPLADGRRVLHEDRTHAASPDGLRFSLAGVQLKFSGRETQRGIAVGLGGDRIVKLADQRYDQVPENEFAIMSWATLSGLNVPKIALVDAEAVVGLPDHFTLRDRCAFVIHRFDRRSDGARVHQEDFAQILALSPREGRKDKYGGTNLDTIARLSVLLSPDDSDELLKRLAFMILSGNNDMHAKNWSMIYPDRVRPRLAPAYDLLCTEVYLKTGEIALPMAGVRRLDLVSMQTFDRLASRIGVDPAHARQVVRDFVRQAKEAWPEARHLAPRGVADFIDRWLMTAPLAR